MRGVRLDGLPKDPTNQLLHGSVDGYNNHGCRCRPCKNAWAAHMLEWFAQRAEKDPCGVEDCDDGLYSRGYCKAHYERLRTGKPLVSPIVRRPNAYGHTYPGKRR